MRYRPFALLAVLALAAHAPVCADEREFRFDQFYAGGTPEGPIFSPAAKSHEGKRIRIAGYAAPAFRAEASFFVMTRTPMHVCPFCNPDTNWPVDVIVVYTRKAPPAGGPAPIEVTGVLETGPKADPETGMTSQLRLVDAVVGPAR